MLFYFLPPFSDLGGGGGGGCTPLYKGRVGVLGLGVESGMVFEGTTGAYMNGRIYRFSSR